MKNICEYFKYEIEYPSNEAILNDPPDDVMFSYISRRYLSLFINYMTILGAYMIRRYMSHENFCEAIARIDSMIKDDSQFHTNVSNCDEFDDILILGRSGEYYYVLWTDCDTSDCCFGKLSKSHFNGNNELALDSFRVWAVDRSKYFHNNEPGY